MHHAKEISESIKVLLSRGDNARIAALSALFTYFSDIGLYGKKDVERAENWLNQQLKKDVKSTA